MKMKNILMIVIIAFSLSAHAQSNSFNININIKGISSSSASLTVFGEAENVVFDESIVNNSVKIEDGRFRITGKTDVSVILRVWLREDKHLQKYVGNSYIPNKSSQLWLVVSPGSELNITGDLVGKDFMDVYCESDEENILLAILNKKMIPLISQSLNLKILAMDETLHAEKTKELLDKMNNLEDSIKKIRNEFIVNHSSSIAALWLMEDMLIRSQIEPSYLEEPISKVAKQYNNHYFYCSVRNRVDGARNLVIGSICPPIEGTDVNGNHFSIEQLKGKFVIIDFWGTWCGPCLAGMPKMKEFKDKHGDKVEILGIAQDKNYSVWKQCIIDKEMNWINLLNGRKDNDYVSKMNVQGYPTKIVIDPKGKILSRSSGETDEFYEKLEQTINNYN